MDAIAPAVTVTAAMLVAFALALVERRYWLAELFGGRQTAARSESAIRSAANFLTLDPGALAQPSPPTRATAENVAILPQVTSIEVNARPDGRIRPIHEYRGDTTAGSDSSPPWVRKRR
jgi:hypothetical protein